jgi:hypothetical protein
MWSSFGREKFGDPFSVRALRPRRPAERHFPVGISVARDQIGRERQYDEMRRWLDEAIGANRWRHVEERLPALRDTFPFYFVADADAQALIDRFSCGVWVAGDWPRAHAAISDEHDMRWVGRMHKA